MAGTFVPESAGAAPMLGGPGAACLAEVVSVRDPDGLSRVQVRLLGWDGVEGQDAPVWARVAVPFAGKGRGAFFIPDVGDEVLVCFVHGDPRQPVVVGSLWSGGQRPPERISGSRVDRWSLTARSGTRISIVDAAGGPEITLETPGGVSAVLTDQEGGSVELTAAGNTVTLDPGGVTVSAGSQVTVQASQVSVTAGMVQVDAGVSQFSGLVKCDVLQTNTVIATSYTPGAGNIW